MTWLAHLNARLSALVLVLARLCLAGLGCIVLYGVVMRYVFNNEPPYVEQLALLLVISVSMFGAACVAHDAGHIGLDSLVNRLPPALRHLIARAVALSTLVFAIVILYGAYEMATSTRDNLIPTLGISEAWRYLPLIIAGALIALFSIDRLLRRMPAGDDTK
jgi:TRAP-type C4-dicarboxylate transport system permease small subunit